MTCGIYKIKNNINHQIYIGQSYNIEKRWREHLHDSINENNKDFNMVIHKAIRKYGRENFSFSIIEKCSKEELNDKEIYWIKFYDSYYHGYNCSKGGNNYDHLGKIVQLYDFDGNYITEYPSIKDTAINLKRSYNVVCQVLYGQRKSCAGFQLKFKDDLKIIKKYQSNQGGCKKVYQIDKNTNKILNVFYSVNEAARKINLDTSSISKVCRGKLKTHGGYKWSYENPEGDL